MQYPKCSSWLEIDAKSLKNNIEFLKKNLKSNATLGCVLKANAYGHGLKEVLSVIHGLIDTIHLISPSDALEVRHWERERELKPIRILVIGAVDPSELVCLAEESIEVVLGDESWWPLPAPLLESLDPSRPLMIHLHVDTGLGREGFLPQDVARILEGFQKGAPGRICLRGVMSHFSNTEDVTEQTYALSQWGAFDHLKSQLKEFEGVEYHIGASAAALVLPQSQDTAVRTGISLYGFWPSNETRLSYKILNPQGVTGGLEPVLSWKVKSQYVKWLPTGSFVGYGCTFKCERDTRIAVLPVGYFDGYPRILSGRAYVLVDGHRCPVLGRVMMNHIVIDVTSVPHVGPSLCAVLLGRSGGQVLGAETLAQWAETIHYECVARLGAHLPRVVVHAQNA